jgi:hypothetical protein
MLEYVEVDDDDDTVGYEESDGIIHNTGNITPFKGSMLGGTVIGEENGARSEIISIQGL